MNRRAYGFAKACAATTHVIGGVLLCACITRPDNAMKVNAFFQEALDYANAYPNKPMSEIFRTAGDIARATTPVYSRVPKGLKQLNLIGVIPTYISFVYEI